MEWKTWPQTSLKNKDRLPEYSGIYIVVANNHYVWYVGQAKNLRSRWMGNKHHRYYQLNKSEETFAYIIYYHQFPEEQLDEKERYYINLLDPILNGTEVKTYVPRILSPEQEIKRILKVLSKPNQLFPVIRSLIAGQYIDKKEIIHIICLINANDFNILENSATKKHRGLIKKAWSGLYRHSNSVIVWINTPIYTIPGYKFEFYSAPEVINYLHNHNSERTHYVDKRTILGVEVLWLRDPEILTRPHLSVEEKLKQKLPLLQKNMNIKMNSQQELSTSSEELISPIPMKMTRWLSNSLEGFKK